jgi:DNA-directed RNA polymerase subunit M/transcription elongation factor TFIIS
MPHGPSPSCVKCGHLIPWSAVSIENETICRKCGKLQDITLFSAIYRRLVENAPQAREALPEEATCFYYPEKRAQYVCSLSGRFICEDAATDWEGKKVSIEALLRLKKEENADSLKTSAVLYDDIALSVAIFPLIIWPLTIFTPAIVYYYVFRYWGKGPTGLMRKSRWRYLVAFLIATLQWVFWGFLFSGMFSYL